MSTHTIKGFIVWRQWDFQDKPDIEFTRHCPNANTAKAYAEHGAGEVLVREHQFDVEVPDSFDPTADVIAQLQAHKQELRSRLAQQLMAIDERISKLQALPMPQARPEASS